jgi:hypothetical protein
MIRRVYCSRILKMKLVLPRVLYMKTDIHFLSYLAQFFLEWEMFQTKVVEKIKTHILCSVTFFRKSCRLWDNVGKYCRVGRATDGNMAHARCVLDTYGYRHTLRICNYLLLLHHNSSQAQAPQCYATLHFVKVGVKVLKEYGYSCVRFKLNGWKL